MTTLELVSLEERLEQNSELRKEDLAALKKWCNEQPHLPKITDSELVIFLHSRYYLLEPTKKAIDNFFTIRTHLPALFANRDPLGCEEMKKQMEFGVYLCLKGTTKEGYRVIYAKSLDLDPFHFDFDGVMKLCNMVVDLAIFSRETCRGFILLFDMQGYLISHAGRMTPLGLKKILIYLQEALPIRLKGLHFMNSVPMLEIVLAMMKPFMKKELLEMVHIHSNEETLNNFIPLEILPNECGGKAGPRRKLGDEQYEEVKKYRNWFVEEEATRKVDESLRPGGKKTDVFGAENIRELNFD